MGSKIEPGGVRETILGALEASWGVRGGVRGAIWGPWGPLGGSREPLGGVPGASGKGRKPILEPRGAPGGVPGASWGGPGGLWGGPGGLPGGSRGPPGRSRGPLGGVTDAARRPEAWLECATRSSTPILLKKNPSFFYVFWHLRRKANPFFWGGRRGPGAPREGDLGGGMDSGLEATSSRTPMGQRPGEFI